MAIIKTQRKKIIEKIILNAIKNSWQFSIAQKKEADQFISIPLKLIFQSETKLVFEIINESQSSDLVENELAMIQLPSMGMLFRVEYFKKSQILKKCNGQIHSYKVIVTSYPLEISMSERRKCLRSKFLLRDLIFVQLKHGEMILSSQLVDCSPMGICLIFNESALSQIDPSESFYINQIGSTVVVRKIELKVKYHEQLEQDQDKEKDKVNLYRLGFEFLRELKNEERRVFEILMDYSQKRIQSLGKMKFIGISKAEQLNTLLNIKRTDPDKYQILVENIEKLQTLAYLNETQLNQFFSHIDHYTLANALGLMTKDFFVDFLIFKDFNFNCSFMELVVIEKPIDLIMKAQQKVLEEFSSNFTHLKFSLLEKLSIST